MKLRGLYAITPQTADIVDAVRAAAEGGAALLQYRRKDGDVREAREVLAISRRYGVPLIVNDDLELALEIGADGVHLGRYDGDLAFARAKLEGKILGASCYNERPLARKAIAAGVDYIAFGSVFASQTKPAAVRAPLSLFGEFRSQVALCAIGGVTLASVPGLLAAGADLVAVITDLFEAPDVRARAAAYRRLFG